MTCLMVCILHIFDKTILLTVYLMDVSSSSNYSGIFIFIMYVCNGVFYELRIIQLKNTHKTNPDTSGLSSVTRTCTRQLMHLHAIYMSW